MKFTNSLSLESILKPFPEKMLVVPVVINIIVSPLQASPGLERKKWADLAWRYCNPMSQAAFFHIWPRWPGATRWGSAFWQLVQGHRVQSKSGPCGHNTSRALGMIQLGLGPVFSVPNGKWSLCPAQGSTALWSTTLFFPCFSTFVFSLSCCIEFFITYHWPQTSPKFMCLASWLWTLQL